MRIFILPLLPFLISSPALSNRQLAASRIPSNQCVPNGLNQSTPTNQTASFCSPRGTLCRLADLSPSLRYVWLRGMEEWDNIPLACRYLDISGLSQPSTSLYKHFWRWKGERRPNVFIRSGRIRMDITHELPQRERLFYNENS